MAYARPFFYPRFSSSYAASTLFGSSLAAQQQSDLWENYCLVLEALEEKQPHLVHQILPRVAALATAAPSLHPSWLFVVFARFFHHQNVIVVKYGLAAFLQAETVAGHCGGKGEMVPLLAEFLVNQLFAVLNESRIYSVAEDKQHYGETLR